MSRGFWIGLGLGAIASLSLGVGIAVLPTTPSWALWRLTQAVESQDMDTIQEMVDLPSLAGSAIADLSDSESGTGVDLGDLARTFLDGGSVHTIFDDPADPVEIRTADLIAAWWGMETDGDRASWTLRADEQDVDLEMEHRGGRWIVVSIRPVGALLRVTPPTRAERT